MKMVMTNIVVTIFSFIEIKIARIYGEVAKLTINLQEYEVKLKDYSLKLKESK